MTGAPEAILVKGSEPPEQTAGIIFDELRRDFGDWMTFNEDLVRRPSIDLTKEGNEFALRTLIPGIASKDIEILVAPNILMVRGKDKTKRLLSSIRFPRSVNPARVHAELKDGMLSIKAEMARGERTEPILLRAA